MMKGEVSPVSHSLMVKICGITTLEDATACTELGADALGFNFYSRSPRYVESEEARRICSYLPSEILKIAVIVLSSEERLDDLGGFDIIQVHGIRSEEELSAFSGRIWVATTPEAAPAFPEQELIIDSSWGTGRVGDWEAAARLGRPFVLSGGLHPGNVGEAVRRLRPEGVDVCSGVESKPGIKDYGKVKKFIQEARNAAGNHSRPKN